MSSSIKRFAAITLLLAIGFSLPAASLGQEPTNQAEVKTSVLDAQGRLVKETFQRDRNNDGVFDQTESIAFGYADGQLVMKLDEVVAEPAQTTLRRQVTTFEYDETGRVVREVLLQDDRNGNDRGLMRIDSRFTHGPSDLTAKRISFDMGDDGAIDRVETTTFEYFPNRLLSRESIEFDDDNDGAIDRKSVTDFEYDARRLVTKSIAWTDLKSDRNYREVTEYVRSADGAVEFESTQVIKDGETVPLREANTLRASVVEVEETVSP